MPTPLGRSFAIGPVVALVVATLAATTPVAAQFGGLKKKASADAAAKAAEEAAKTTGVDPAVVPGAPTAAAAPAAGPATQQQLVLTPAVLDRLVAGIKARSAVQEAARKEDTPYGRYHKELAAYEKNLAAYKTAKSKCDAAIPGLAQRMAADQKLYDKYNALMEKAMDAAGKRDYERQAEYTYEALGLADPSCKVRQPKDLGQPDDLWDMQRKVDERAEQEALKAAEMSRWEFGKSNDDVIGILSGSPPPDRSPSEKTAVNSRSAELKNLMGLNQPPPAPPAAAAPAPAAAAPAAVQGPVMPAGALPSECEVKNIQDHEAEIDALGDRGLAASEAGNNALLMAISDSINRIRMAGCVKSK
jgi:hypothetical protein